MSAASGAPRPQAPLRTLQLVWSAFVGVLTLVGVLVPFIAPSSDGELPVWLPATLALVVGLAVVGGVVVLDRTFAASPPSDDEAAATQYRSRLFLQAALTEFPALLSVVMAFVIGPPWVAAVGAFSGVVALLVVRPSTAHLDRLDASWRARGADVSLRRGLLGEGGP